MTIAPGAKKHAGAKRRELCDHSAAPDFYAGVEVPHSGQTPLAFPVKRYPHLRLKFRL
jgi:hypothetical protein